MFWVIVCGIGISVHAMNLDFHYYGTYVAARLAGYTFNEAQIIAHAAQYVDDSSRGMLSERLKPYMNPVPTVQAFDLSDFRDNFYWSDEFRKTVADVWIPFHFLPGNYDINPKEKYRGPINDKGIWERWFFDDESEQQFKLLCLPDSTLVKEMINDITFNHLYKSYALQLIGLRMHVLADTWAHMYFAGTQAWFINDAGENVYKIIDGKYELVKWQRIWPWNDGTDIIYGEQAAPNSFWYNSITYLGHGRIGHLPDYPWFIYEYNPRWSNTTKKKNNFESFFVAIKQLTYALSCIKNKKPFDINTYPSFEIGIEKALMEILGTREYDQTKTWIKNIPGIKNYEVPGPYSKEKWMKEALEKPDITNTYYYNFNISATWHLDFVRNFLEEKNIYIDSIPRENIVFTKIKNNKKGDYIGASYIGNSPVSPEKVPYPTLKKSAVTIKIIKPTFKLLTSGDVVELCTHEPLSSDTQQKMYLGAWTTPSLYYYLRQYSISGQKWKIEKVDVSKDKKIRTGDQVRFKNVHYVDKPYLAPYYTLIPPAGDYLTTQTEPDEGTIWILEDLKEFDMYKITEDYFVGGTIGWETSRRIYSALKQNGMINEQGIPDINRIKNILDQMGTDFIKPPLKTEAEKRRVIKLLRKLING